LAQALVEYLRETPGARVLEFASGRGRNTEALRAAGLIAVAIDDPTAASPFPFAGIEGPFAGALSTHGLLHGSRETVSSNLHAIVGLLEPGAWLCATFGSVRDARFGIGSRVDAFSYAPEDGDERGVAHAFFDRVDLRAALERGFEIRSMHEGDAGGTAGQWAHPERPLSDAIHWFVTATAK
jgi:hypothetical protein